MSLSRLSSASRGFRGSQKLQKSFNTSFAQLNPNTTMESLNVEVRSFMSKRKISKIAWWSFIFLTIANTLTLISSLCPGWAWTREINGEMKIAGEYYGIYGIWYVCWESTDGAGSRICELADRISFFQDNSYVMMAKALNCLTVIGGFLCFVTLGAYMCVPMLNHSYKVLIGYTAAASVTALINVSLFISYAFAFLLRAYECCDPERRQTQLLAYGLTYSFVLSCMGSAFFMATAVSAGCEITTMKKERRLARKMRRPGLRHYEPEHQFIDPRTLMAYNPLLMGQ